MYPLPSRSYILNAHFSFCSSLPREVTLRAMMNSLKSIVPSPLVSKVRKTCSANFDASPYGKKFAYIFLNSSTVKWPVGQSFRKPLYHSWSSWSVNSVFSRRSWSTSGRSLLFCFPILFWVRVQQLQSKRKSAWAPATLGREELGRGRTLQETEGPLWSMGERGEKGCFKSPGKDFI